jgi:hypothetical protein
MLLPQIIYDNIPCPWAQGQLVQDTAALEKEKKINVSDPSFCLNHFNGSVS